jgi:hypothetical protein
MNQVGVSKVVSLLSRNEELFRLRQGVVLRTLNIQKREYYRILKTIKSFDNKPFPPQR